MAYRFAVGVALTTAFILLWVNGAVGIIGDESNDANIMYFGVLAVGFIGAIIARFRPLGMARALYAMALAQVLAAGYPDPDRVLRCTVAAVCLAISKRSL